VTNQWTLLVEDGSDEHGLLLSKENVEIQRRRAGVVILSWAGAPDEEYWRSLGLARQFERIWVASDLSSSRVAVSELFNSISAGYGAVVDVQRNVDCYNYLINVCGQYGGAPISRLLDVGCGDGLIMRAAIDPGIHIAGYDLSVEIARLAHDRGLEVLDDAAFRNGRGDFDASVSCYSMHYFVEPSSTIGYVARHLKPAGVWSMNFHKDIMFEEFLGCLDGSEMHRISDSKTTFGRVLLVGRRQ